MTPRPTPRLLLAVAAVVCAAMLDTGPVRGQGPGAFVAPALDTALRQGSAGDTHTVWVYFRDKGAGPTVRPAPLTARALGRRARRASAATRQTTYEDQPVAAPYQEQVAARVRRVRHALRWFNALSVEATAAQVRTLAELPFVEKLDLVHRAPRREEPIARPDDARDDATGPARPRSGFDYGSSLAQVAQLRVPELHDRGLNGAGVVVALFDSGFPSLDHEALSELNIVAERDFVLGLDSVRSSTDTHGLATLSVIGGYRSGQLIGPAYAASFVLAVTEDSRSERPVEEDNWAAAAEWAEAMGADMISSSLGYSAFDEPFPGYSDRDMDGVTAVTTRAAAMAAARGIVVVNSAGNGGYHPTRNTLGAPADGFHVLAAGGVDRTGARSTFSSVGPSADGRFKPDVAALGTAVKVAVAGPWVYGFANGTSFACPLIAGVAALVLQAHPAFTVDEVLLSLRSTASQSGAPDNLLGWGVVDAAAAVAFQPPSRPSP